jgi:Contact-dependent growth inhibition CdiA C-terminal domain
MRHLDGPGRNWQVGLDSMRERLDALPANHPSSPRFADGPAQVDVPAQPKSREPDAGRDRELGASDSGREVERHGDGFIDERARVFQPAERAVAEVLALRGATVTALAEDHSLRQRQPDALVDGRVTEFKNIRPGATDATIKNQLRAAQGQAPNVVIDARNSGLDENSAA